MAKSTSSGKNPASAPDSPKGDDDRATMEAAAEAYLDLWQENLKNWASEPEALRKWLAENAPKSTDP